MMGPRPGGAAGPAGVSPMMGPAEAPGRAGIRGGSCAVGNPTLMDLIDESSELDMFAMMVEVCYLFPVSDSPECHLVDMHAFVLPALHVARGTARSE